MAAKQDKPHVGFLAREIKEDGSVCGNDRIMYTWRLTVVLVAEPHWNEFKLTNPVHGDHRDLDDLAIEIRLWSDLAPSVEIEYSQPYSVDLYRAKGMVKVLQRVHRNLQRYEQQFGVCSVYDVGSRVARMIKAAGGKGLLRFHGHGRGPLYSNSEYRKLEMGAIAQWINGQIHEQCPKARMADPAPVTETV